MLVLTRRTDQSIDIGDNIRIVVVRLKCGSVQLGIEAPPEINVRRSELTTDDRKQLEPVGG
ncbi:MAG: carbon storage regulator [Planctomycetaceae bacterium]|nr:carbon storage regulator [Planctomycetales bacterium]MCB9927182.1 carbon storage regulator [Planctomycetaceae bacterium]